MNDISHRHHYVPHVYRLQPPLGVLWPTCIQRLHCSQVWRSVFVIQKWNLLLDTFGLMESWFFHTHLTNKTHRRTHHCSWTSQSRTHCLPKGISQNHQSIVLMISILQVQLSYVALSMCFRLLKKIMESLMPPYICGWCFRENVLCFSKSFLDNNLNIAFYSRMSEFSIIWRYCPPLIRVLCVYPYLVYHKCFPDWFCGQEPGKVRLECFL